MQGLISTQMTCLGGCKAQPITHTFGNAALSFRRPGQSYHPLTTTAPTHLVLACPWSGRDGEGSTQELQ